MRTPHRRMSLSSYSSSLSLSSHCSSDPQSPGSDSVHSRFSFDGDSSEDDRPSLSCDSSPPSALDRRARSRKRAHFRSIRSSSRGSSGTRALRRLYRSTIGRPLVLVAVLFAVFVLVSSYSGPVMLQGPDPYSSTNDSHVQSRNRASKPSLRESAHEPDSRIFSPDHVGDLDSPEDVHSARLRANKHMTSDRDDSRVSRAMLLLEDEGNDSGSRSRQSRAFMVLQQKGGDNDHADVLVDDEYVERPSNGKQSENEEVGDPREAEEEMTYDDSGRENEREVEAEASLSEDKAAFDDSESRSERGAERTEKQHEAKRADELYEDLRKQSAHDPKTAGNSDTEGKALLRSKRKSGNVAVEEKFSYLKSKNSKGSKSENGDNEKNHISHGELSKSVKDSKLAPNSKESSEVHKKDTNNETLKNASGGESKQVNEKVKGKSQKPTDASKPPGIEAPNSKESSEVHKKDPNSGTLKNASKPPGGESKQVNEKVEGKSQKSTDAPKPPGIESKHVEKVSAESEKAAKLKSLDNNNDRAGSSETSKAPAGKDEAPKMKTSKGARIKELLSKAKNTDERITVNKYFDAVFVLNLKRKPERWLQTRARLERHGIHAEVIEGVDGYLPHHTADFNAWIDTTPQTDDEIQKGLRAYRSPGSWAYQLSSERAIELAIERGYSNFLLLDDDILIHKDFENEFHEKIQLIDPDWKILFLGASQYSWHDRAALFKNKKDPFYTPMRTVGSFAVAFDQSTYQTILDGIKLREGAFDAFPMQRVILANLNDSYCFYPNMITADVTASDTQKGKDQYEHSKVMRWRMDEMDLEPVHESLLSWPPLISIITTVRNAASTIELALLSLLEQTYANIECIVVDDDSSDNTVELIRQLQQFDDRIVLIENKEHIGTYPSRNVALGRARGEVIVVHDGDDIALPDRVERQVEPIIYGHARFTWGFAIRSHLGVRNFTSFFERDELDWEDMDVEVQSARTHVQENKDWSYCCREIVGLMTTSFHRSVFDDIGLFDLTPFGGDAEFTERFLAYYTGELIEPDDVINSYLLRNSALNHNLGLRIETPPLLWSIEKSDTDDQNLSVKIPIKGEKRRLYREQYTRGLKAMVEHRKTAN